jgi:hypothetical protein
MMYASTFQRVVLNRAPRQRDKLLRGSSREPDLVDFGERLGVSANKTAHEFRTREVTEAQEPDALVGGAMLP